MSKWNTTWVHFPINSLPHLLHFPTYRFFGRTRPGLPTPRPLVAGLGVRPYMGARGLVGVSTTWVPPPPPLPESPPP